MPTVSQNPWLSSHTASTHQVLLPLLCRDTPSGPSLTATPLFNAFPITPAGCNFSSSLFTSCIVFPALSIPPVRPQTSSLPSTFSDSHHLWSNYCSFPVLPAFCLALFSLFSTLKYLFQKTDMIMSATGLNVSIIANTY